MEDFRGKTHPPPASPKARRPDIDGLPRETLVALNLFPSLSPLRKTRLAAAHRDPDSLWKELLSQNAFQGERNVRRRLETEARQEMRRARELGISILIQSDPEYPSLLKEIPDPPIVLYSQGAPLSADALTIVGTRRASPYGLKYTERFCRELASAGCLLVSGLARGIDSAVHRTALDVQKQSCAVLPTGLLSLYPAVNRDLAKRILSNGGTLLSEFPLERSVRKFHFPVRNRILAGITRGTFVTEAPAKSGALITAFLAVEYDRLVWTLPHSLGRFSGVGCLRLLRCGAIPVTAASEILEDLRIPVARSSSSSSQQDATNNADIKKILEVLDPDGGTIEELMEATALEPGTLYTYLMKLELAGQIHCDFHGRYRIRG